MGIGANLPIALAPGMGLNAYFTCKSLDSTCSRNSLVMWRLES